MTTLAALLTLAPLTGLTKDDLKRLAAARCSDDAILMVMKAEGPVPPLSVEDLVELRNAGLSPRVLRALVISSPLPPVLVEEAGPPPLLRPFRPCRPAFHFHRRIRACPRRG